MDEFFLIVLDRTRSEKVIDAAYRKIRREKYASEVYVLAEHDAVDEDIKLIAKAHIKKDDRPFPNAGKRIWTYQKLR